MTYMQQLEEKLREWLDSFAEGDVSKDQFIVFLKQSHLDSYHNGQNAGPRQAPQSNRQAAHGTSQSAPSTSQAAHSNDHAAQSGRREWHTKNRSAGNAPVNRGQYRS